MAIEVGCACGQRFAADQGLVGQVVACPACGRGLPIPAPQAPVVYDFGCVCGRRWRVDSSAAGRPFACDQCGRQGAIPPPPAAQPAQPVQPFGADPLSPGNQASGELFPDALAAWVDSPKIAAAGPTPEQRAKEIAASFGQNVSNEPERPEALTWAAQSYFKDATRAPYSPPPTRGEYMTARVAYWAGAIILVLACLRIVGRFFR